MRLKFRNFGIIYDFHITDLFRGFSWCKMQRSTTPQAQQYRSIRQVFNFDWHHVPPLARIIHNRSGYVVKTGIMPQFATSDCCLEAETERLCHGERLQARR